MANLQETPQWETGVYQIEETDPVMGGPDGIDNLPHKHLANRTAWLKQERDKMANEIAAARAGKASLSARLDDLETQTMQGDSAFAGNAGRSITHGLGHTNYIVNLTALDDTQGDLGDVRIARAANAFTVYNTGGFRGQFRYQLMT